MKIYTSYYGNRNLPKDAHLIAVSAKVPAGFTVYDHVKSLAPTWDIYNEYKQSGDAERYTKRFKEEVLVKHDKELFSDHLYNLMYKYEKDVILLCYEKPNEFCHRHLIAEWLDMGIEEWKIKCDICGAETAERSEWFCDFLIYAGFEREDHVKYDYVCDDCLNAIRDTIERRKRRDGLKFEDVMPALRRGENIRHKGEEDAFFYMLDGRLFRQVFIPAFNEWVICDHSIGSEIFMDDWEVIADMDEITMKGGEE